MMRDQYVLFIKKWKENPVEGFSLQDSEDFNKYLGINHTKIMKNNTVMCSKEEYNKPGQHGIWIDVFPLDKVPFEKKHRKKIFRAAKIKILCTKSMLIYNRGFLIFFVSIIMHFVPSFLKRIYWNRAHKTIINYSKYSRKHELCILSMTTTLKWLFPSDMMDNTDNNLINMFLIDIVLNSSNPEYSQLISNIFATISSNSI